MKQKQLYGLLSAAALTLLATGCSDDFNPTSSRSGKICPMVELDSEVVTARSASRASSASIGVNDLKLKLTSADGSVNRQWNSVADFNSNEEFKVGTYTMEAIYGTSEDEGFETPYYYGSANLVVAENEVSQVSLNVGLSNAMLIIEPTDAFKNYFTTSKFNVVSTSGNAIEYTSDETRPVYVKPGEITVSAEVTKPNGVSGTLTAAKFTAEAKHCYSVKVDVNGGQAGDASLVITFDELVDQEEVVIDLSDELLSTPAPELGITGFESGVTYTIIEGVTAELAPEIFINARGGIQSVIMKTTSKTLIDQGWPEEIDLTQATTVQQNTLSNLGLTARGIYKNADKIALIDLKNVIANMHYVTSGSNENVISIKVADKLHKESEEVVLNVNVLNIELSIVSAGIIDFDDDKLDVVVSYNGPSIADNVKIQYKNDRGTWSNATIVSTIDNNDGTYKLSLSGLPIEDDVTIRAAFGTSYSEEVVARRANGVVASPVSGESTARSATIQLKMTPELDPNDAVVEISSDGGNTYTAANGSLKAPSRAVKYYTYVINNLEPSKTYKVKVSLDEFESYTNVTTETPMQLPNAGMEDWCQTDSGRNWELIYPGTTADASSWGTNNPMTTSQGSDYAYCRISGTISTTDAHSGSAAALIRTVGWGSGNTATGSTGSKGTTKYVDAGLLHLGSSRTVRPDRYSDREGALTTDDLTCGIDFTSKSRPEGMTFWYKYSAKNSSDKGYAEITITDAVGTVIGTGTTLLDAAGTYTEVNVPISYTSDASAAKVYVKFLSTNDRSFLQKNDNNLSGPGFANLSRGTFMGSQLYIDDITLNY